MYTNADDVDIQTGLRLFQRQVIVRATMNSGALDGRTSAIILKSNVFDESEFRNQLSFPLESIVALRDIGSSSRLVSNHGPLLIVKENIESQHASIYNISELLLSDNLNVRKAAIDYFISASIDSPILTKRSVDFLENKIHKIADTDVAVWVDAAVQAFDLLENDWLLSLAGVRQSFECRYEEGIQKYLKVVLAPTHEAIDGLAMSMKEIVVNVEEIADTISSIAKDSHDFIAALDSYFTAFGHLPLSCEYGMNRLVNEWIKFHEPIESIWQKFTDWASRNGSPLCIYHACQVVANTPGLLNKDDEEAFWLSAVNIIRRPINAQTDDIYDISWYFRCQLSKHFCYHIETLFPIKDGDATAALAWWLAERFSNALGKEEQTLFHIYKVVIEPALDYSKRIWLFSRSVVHPSDFRFGTLHVTSIWATALLCQLKRIVKIHAENIPLSTRSVISEAIITTIISAFPSRKPLEIAPKYAFDEGVIETAKEWINMRLSTGETHWSEEWLTAILEMGEIERFEQAFESLGDIEGSTRDYLLLCARSFAYAHRISDDLLTRCIENKTWTQSAQELSDTHLEMLFSALCEYQVNTDSKWHWQLPHFYAALCEQASVESRINLLFGMTVVSSLNSNVTSAIVRLLSGNRKADLHEYAIYWRARLDELRGMVPECIAARFRAITTALHIL